MNDEDSDENLILVNFLKPTSTKSKKFIWPLLDSGKEDKTWVEEGKTLEKIDIM